MRLRRVEIDVVWDAAGPAGAPAAAPPEGPVGEHEVRAAYRRTLEEAERQGHREVTLRALGVGAPGAGLAVVASAKILAQEAIRFARTDPAHVKRVCCSPRDRSGFEAFRKAVEGYVRHFLEVLAWGPMVVVDAIVEAPGGVVVIERSNPPFGFALPGGFVDYGESLEEAVRREVAEETGLAVTGLRQFHTYSDPGRDPRFHTISTVFAAQADAAPRAGDDAAAVRVVPIGDLAGLAFAFDHGRIVADWLRDRAGR